MTVGADRETLYHESLFPYRVLWLGRPLRFGRWYGFWHGTPDPDGKYQRFSGRHFDWMFDIGPVRIAKLRTYV